VSYPDFEASKVAALVEARKRFWLFDQQQGARDPKFVGEGNAINEAGAVLLSAEIQAYLEQLFIECSEKLFGRKLSQADLKSYRETWSRWGNPSPQNVRRLFRRLGIIDVFLELGGNQVIPEGYINFLEELNQVRNDIAHGEEPKINGQKVELSLPMLEGWLRLAERGTKSLRFNVLYCCDLQHGSGDLP
jgi:hypothetical protein